MVELSEYFGRGGLLNRVVFGKVVTLLLIGALISVLGAQSVKADTVERKVGVKAGDWVKYSWNETFYSNDPEQLYYASIDGTYSRLETELMTVAVLNVLGTNITYGGLLRFKNGTEKEVSPFTMDVNGTNGYVFVSANLSVGDALLPYVYEYHPSPPDLPHPPKPPYIPRVNETIYREYLGEIREINHVNRTDTESEEYPPKYISYYVSSQQYFDRATGVPVEWTGIGYLVTNEGYVTNRSILMKIVDTNIWGPHVTPEFNIIAYVFSFVIATATVSVVYLRQRKKQQA